MTARMADSSAYLLFEPPARHEESHDLHRRNCEEEEDADVQIRHPESRRKRNRGEDQHAREHEHDGRQVVDGAVGRRRHHVFLHHQLDGVGDRLQQAVRANL